MSDTTDTPLVDANSFASPYTSVAGEVTAYEMVDANFARDLERHLTAALAREKALREALEGVVHDVQEWCNAVERDSSWDGWDEHYKDFAYRGGLDAARAALSTTPTA